MTSYVALLRGVNIGGRLLKMQDLKRMAVEIGLGSPRTYIASGNLLFESSASEPTLKRDLEAALKAHFGEGGPGDGADREGTRASGVRQPLRDEPGNKVVAIFLDFLHRRMPRPCRANLADERLALGEREIYVHYPSGMGRSKLAFRPPARVPRAT